MAGSTDILSSKQIECGFLST